MRGCSMAASDKKLQSFNAFNSGEYSKDLAGRTDLESFGSSTRYSSNFLTQVSGGLKKFYGTRHITEQALVGGYSKVKLIPFINKYEPMAFIVYGRDINPKTEEEGKSEPIKVGLIYGDNYKDLNIRLPNTINVDELRWKQINDRLLLCHKSIMPTSIDFFGIDINGDYIFEPGDVVFSEVPYFPVGTTNDYRGELVANRLDGTVTLSIPSNTSDIKFEFTPTLIAQSSYVRSDNVKCNLQTFDKLSDYAQVYDSTIAFYRDRSGTITSLASGKVNVYSLTKRQGSYDVNVTDRITKEKVLQVVKTISPQAYIDGSYLVTPDLQSHQNGDKYYMVLSVGNAQYRTNNSLGSPGPWRVLWNAFSEQSNSFTPTYVTTDSLDIVNLQGRKIKFFFNDDTEISPWWQGKTVAVGDYAYSNGHWYKALSAGACGNVQPSHTYGTRSDGGVAWKYVHSGSTTATVGDIVDASSFNVYVANGQELPKNTANRYKIYAWSIWGKDGVYPSDIYMVGNRLGFVCNTLNYGSWNAMSVTDDYYNFDTEEYGEQLDTSAIVHLVGNNESSDINWVLARKDVYMGGYSGEYHITPSAIGNRTGAYTPTTTYVQNISNMGGKSVVPLKYKELNMFVGLTGKELYTVAYDYTIDDYTPKSLGYLTEHIMDRGIKRLEALNNKDRNIYLLHDTKQLSLFNYAAEQKVMGFSELNFGDDVIDFVSTYAKDVVAAYVVTYRNNKSATISQTRGGISLGDLTIDVEKFSKMVSGDGSYGFEYGVGDWYHNSEVVNLEDYGISFTGTPHATDEITVEYIAQRITIERFALQEPNYMFDEILQGDGTLADFQPIPHFANRTVYIRYGEGFSQFTKVQLDASGDISHDPLTGVYLPQAKYFKVGIPMVAEMHTQPAFGNKVEGHQQQSLSMYLRLVNSGAFEYGSSVDFTKYFRHEYWNTQQEFGASHRLFTGDMKLEIPLGYAEAQNQGEGPYPNTSAVGINIKSDTPEPLNILSIQEIYR